MQENNHNFGLNTLFLFKLWEKNCVYHCFSLILFFYGWSEFFVVFVFLNSFPIDPVNIGPVGPMSSTKNWLSNFNERMWFSSLKHAIVFPLSVFLVNTNFKKRNQASKNYSLLSRKSNLLFSNVIEQHTKSLDFTPRFSFDLLFDFKIPQCILGNMLFFCQGSALLSINTEIKWLTIHAASWPLLDNVLETVFSWHSGKFH